MAGHPRILRLEKQLDDLKVEKARLRVIHANAKEGTFTKHDAMRKLEKAADRYCAVEQQLTEAVKELG